MDPNTRRGRIVRKVSECVSQRSGEYAQRRARETARLASPKAPVMPASCQRVAAMSDSHTLRHVRRVIEAELVSSFRAGATATQAHWGQLEMLEAVTAELAQRGELTARPPYVEVDRETVLGIAETALRLQRSIRVF